MNFSNPRPYRKVASDNPLQYLRMPHSIGLCKLLFRYRSLQELIKTKHRAFFKVLFCLTILMNSPVALYSQSPTAESLEQWIRNGYEFSWERGETMPDEVRDVWRELGSGGTGYGFRTPQIRKGPPDSIPKMEYWSVSLNEIHTSVEGIIGLVWGLHTEKFKVEGESPQTVRVRFTNTLKWNGQCWENLLYHRDAQVFEIKDK